jgi:phage terminase large subunit-like protein
MGYDPYSADKFLELWIGVNGPACGIVKVQQGKRTETVPLGEIKKLSTDRALLFDEAIMTFTMGNCIVEEDTNGNRKLLKKRYADKIDNVSALMDAFVAYKENREAFD